MDFLHFIAQLKIVVGNDIPGERSHQKMQVNYDKSFELPFSKNNSTPAAVLILLYLEDNEIHFFLTKRSNELEHHKGQISLPGGTQEENEKLTHTALRETQEEIGINKTSISIIGSMTPLFVPVTGFMINPFIGYSLNKLEPTPDPLEVEAIFSVNISDLLNEANRTIEQRNIRGYDVEVPYFKLNNYEVWGATSMILSEFRDLIKSINEK
jgi:8-oxo-dGTP pyrophosphatase MutT (NUDIX family)|tara:strand:+ start:1354 stop:1986 length:633 start_codon:yes stop_codon:yes gene_type:complete